MPIICCIALGSNLSFGGRTPAQMVMAAMDALAELGTVQARSSLYETEPVGFTEQPVFVNAVVVLETALPAETLLDRLLKMEQRFGRERAAGMKDGPRTLDLDLLLLGGAGVEMGIETASEPASETGSETGSEKGIEPVMKTERLTVPHPRLAERRFVLVPLVEVAPFWRHPILGRTMEELLRELLLSEEKKSVEAVVKLPF